MPDSKQAHTVLGRALHASKGPRVSLVAALFLVALLLRISVIGVTVGWATPPEAEPASDSRIHSDLARNLLNGAGFGTASQPTASTPPLYPFLLAGIYKVTGHSSAAVRLVQALLGAGTSVLLVYAIWPLYPGRTALLAGAGLAVHPLAVYLSGLTLTETVFLFWLCLVLLLAMRLHTRAGAGHAAALGAVAGLASLTRATFLGFVPLLIGWIYTTTPGNARKKCLIALPVALAAILAIAPWTIRNYLVFGEVILIQGNGGLMFWAGNNPFADGGMVMPSRDTWQAGDAPDGPGHTWQGVSNSESTRRYLQAAFRWIRSNPADSGQMVLRKLSRLYGISRANPQATPAVPPGIAAFSAVFLGLAGIGALLALRQWREAGILYMLVVYQNLIVMIFSGGTRYQASMLPSLATFAALAVATGAVALRARRSILRPQTGLDVVKN